METPKIVNYQGEVTDVSKMLKSKNSKDFRLVTIDQWGSSLITRPVSEKMYQSMKDTLVIGRFVDITCDQRIEGVTEYLDAGGNVAKHAQTGEGITKAVGISGTKFKMVFEQALRANAGVV